MSPRVSGYSTYSTYSPLTGLPRASGVERHTLANGLRVIIAPDHGLPLVGTSLRFGAGSRHEGPGRHGMAHLVEHLMFAGTRVLERGEHLRLVQGVGGNANATTSTDWTSFYQVIGPESLDMVLWLEGERLRGFPSAVSAAAIDTERRVVLNERLLSIDGTHHGRAAERITATAYPSGHPYHHLPIGDPEDLGRLDVGQVVEFFRRHYSPRNAVLALAGDVEASRGLDLVERHLGDWAPCAPDPDTPPPAEVRLTDRTVLTRTGERAPRLFIGVLLPGVADPDYECHRVVALLLAGGDGGGLLVERLGRERGLVTDVHIRLSAQAHHASLAVVELVPVPGCDLDRLEAAYRAEVERLAVGPVDADRLRRAIAMHTARSLARADRTSGLVDDLSLYAVLDEREGFFATALHRARSMTTDQAAVVARAFLGATGSVVLRWAVDR